MKKRAQKFDVDAECKFSDLPQNEIETACKYEYMRESQVLRDEIENFQADWNRTFKPFNSSGAIIASRPRHVLPSFAHENLRASERYHLVYDALWKGGFPKPWNQLDQRAKNELIKRITGWKADRKKSHPPLIIEEASPKPDEKLNYDPDKPHDRLYWRLIPSEPRLLHAWEQSGRKYFFGFIRVDESYSKKETCEFFNKWLATQFAKRTHGNPQFLGKLLQLAAMRVRHHYKRRDRKGILADLTGKAAYKGDEHVADIQLSRDCKDALQFFQSLFRGQRPISATPKS
jgi:hypothetical protein